MFGFDFTTLAGLLVLAGNMPVCTVPEAPQIGVTPSSAPIEYEFNLSSAELNGFRSNTVNPYAPSADTTTGGLRHDRPRIATEVEWGIMSYPGRQVSCLWYKSIKVTIDLSPKIYIASEHDNPVCRAAIVEHEVKHVDMDRLLINQYAYGIGTAVKQAVDQVGPMGPYNYHELEGVREKLTEHIYNAVDSQKFLLHQEMSRRQAEVDSLAEYERVNKICDKAEKW